MHWHWWIARNGGLPLLVALVASFTSVVIAIGTSVVNARSTRKALKYQFAQERVRWEEQAKLRVKEAIDDRKREVFVNVLSDANRVIEGVETLMIGGSVSYIKPLDRERLLRSASEVTLYAGEIGDAMNALSLKIANSPNNKQEGAAWLTEAHQIRDSLIVEMRKSLGIAEDTTK